MERTIKQVECVDCKKPINNKISIRSNQIGVHRCDECQRAYNDNVYLDEHAVSVIRERVDREEGDIPTDFMEYELELNDMLKDY